MNPNATQVGGSHYAAGGSSQHWDYTIKALGNRYLEGNITKYVTRSRKKNGLQDLDKALHYLDKLEAEFTAGRVLPMAGAVRQWFDIHEFCVTNGLNTAEVSVVSEMYRWADIQDLAKIRYYIGLLRTQAIETARRLEAQKAGFGRFQHSEPVPPGYGARMIDESGPISPGAWVALGVASEPTSEPSQPRADVFVGMGGESGGAGASGGWDSGPSSDSGSDAGSSYTSQD